MHFGHIDFCSTLTGGKVHDRDVSKAANSVGHTLEHVAEGLGRELESAADTVGSSVEDAAEGALHELEDFGGEVVDGIEHNLIDPAGHFLQDIGHAADDALHQVEDAAKVGLAAVAEGAAMVGGAVIDAANTVGQGVEDAVNQAARAATSAAKWAEMVGESTLEDLHHTADSAIRLAKDVYTSVKDGLEELAKAFLSLFKDISSFQEALKIKDVLDGIMNYGWRQIHRAVDLLADLAPAVLREGRDNPKLRGARAQVTGLQGTVNQFLIAGESALRPLHEDNQAMVLLHQVMDHATDVFKSVEDAVMNTLRSFGVATDGIEELLTILDPLLQLLFGVVGSSPLKLDLAELYDTIVGAMALLGDWLEKWVITSLKEHAHTLVEELKRAVAGEAYIPGLSELYATVTLFAFGEARKLSIQEALTVPISYFIHVTFRVMAGRNLAPDVGAVTGWIAGLPDLPTAAASLRFFEDFVTGSVDGTSLRTLFGLESRRNVIGAAPKEVAFAISIVASLLEVVGLVLTMFEALAVTVIGGLLLGFSATVVGVMRVFDVLANAGTYSVARIALESTAAYFEISGLGRALLLAIASAREAKELSKLFVGLASLLDLVLVLLEKLVGVALESVKFQAENPPSSTKAFEAGIVDASATILSTVVFTTAGIVQIVDDNALSTAESAGAASATAFVAGAGGAVAPVATKLTRVFDILQKVGTGMEIARTLTGLAFTIDDYATA